MLECPRKDGGPHMRAEKLLPGEIRKQRNRYFDNRHLNRQKKNSIASDFSAGFLKPELDSRLPERWPGFSRE